MNQTAVRFCAAGLVALGAGCSYQSAYQPPADGRPRVVWGAGDDPRVALAGAPLSLDCRAELRRLTGQRYLPSDHDGLIELPEPTPAPSPWRPSGEPRLYSPRFYGPNLSVNIDGPLLVPRLGRPPLFYPPQLRFAPPPLRLPAAGGGGGSVGTLHLNGGGGGGGGSSGGGGGQGLGELALVAIVVAAVILPAVDIGVAAARPESERQSAQAIDLVNAYNDLARSPGSPCSYEVQAAAAGPPAPPLIPVDPPAALSPQGGS